MPIPFGRFSPAPGLTIDRAGNNVAITGTIEAYGSQATADRARIMQETINRIWTVTFPDGVSARCSVTVRYRAPGTPAGNVAQIEVKEMTTDSNVSRFTHNMELNSKDANAFTWVVAHEFGHVLGLDDRYTESIGSVARGVVGGERRTAAQPGYEGNIMAVDNGAMAAQNIRDIAVETNPASWWVNDDDHIRDWVNHHSAAEIAAQPTDAKLQAINTLMSGWISDADVAAMEKIIATVSTADEARTFRARIDLLDFSGLGQRMRIRIALNRLPR